ncbi:hypothetical protein Poli38472_014869 [Pythium oligandrum]|uniref:Uncharacterized protein n=1 Tax=Pythium oligandrum TaxID=41045 RepID=A0A8K1C1X8_PYTOL|nr:hypothetical protein Poli38472_014869 [Pythium oligandrum]|eukprot:TMW54935.1 hypothetical protein Poli38472_014869 [Pythium oligandrum]
MKLWELETKPAKTPLQKLQRCCETNIDWVNFVLDTARVLISCKRVPQARELLELFEKRLLKMKQRPLPFRLWMLSYAKIRVEAGLSRIPTSPEGKKHLEWYLAAPVDDELTLVHLDQFHGCRYFVTAKCVDPTGIFAHTVNQNAPDPHDFFSIGPHVYCGSENEAEHRDAVQFMVMTAQMFGARLKAQTDARVH